MGRQPCCCCGLHKRRWTPEEDQILIKYVEAHGGRNWSSVPQRTGLQRCRKSCRLRWMNHLRPDMKRGKIEPAEENLLITLHAQMGNRWSLIAEHLPGRTDNEIKNYWNNHLRKKRERQETDHTANNAQSLQKNYKQNDIKNKCKMKEKAHRPKAIRLTPFPNAWNDDFGAVRVCGGLDDKLVIGSSSHGGRDEILKDVWDLLADDDDVHDFPDDGKLEKIYKEFLEL